MEFDWNFLFSTGMCLFVYILVYDIADEETEIGRLTVTVKCLDALRAVHAELQSDESDLDLGETEA